MSVTIGYIHGGSVRESFMTSMMQLLATDQGSTVKHFASAQSLYLAEGRNDVVRDFMAGEDEWLWFLDTDIAFDLGVLEALLEAGDRGSRQNRSIIAAAYWNDYVDGRWLTWMERGRSPENTDGYRPLREMPAGLTEIDACGMGCTLIHRSVLEALYDAHVPDPWPWFGHDKLYGFRLGEDVTFCQRARRIGFTVHGLALGVEHTKSTVLAAPTGAHDSGGRSRRAHPQAEPIG